MASTTSGTASTAVSLPALLVPYSTNVKACAPSTLSGLFHEHTPHSVGGFKNLISRTLAAEHDSLSAHYTLSAAAALTGVEIVGAWFPESVGEPESVEGLLDSPFASTLLLEPGRSVDFPCPFDRMISRSVNFDPEIGGRPSFFCTYQWYNAAPFVVSADGPVQPAPDPKVKSLRMNFRGVVKVSALTSAIFN